jgi:hypothetical protein
LVLAPRISSDSLGLKGATHFEINGNLTSTNVPPINELKDIRSAIYGGDRALIYNPSNLSADSAKGSASEPDDTQYVSNQLELFARKKNKDLSLSFSLLKNDNEEFVNSFSDNGSQHVMRYEVDNLPTFSVVTNIYENVASIIDGSKAQNGENINISL